jgi:hypothetical protein
MPRTACRFVLQITNRTIERVQDITEEEARLEGVYPSALVETPGGTPSFIQAFKNRWDELYGTNNPKAWEANPWVWVVTFSIVEQP